MYAHPCRTRLGKALVAVLFLTVSVTWARARPKDPLLMHWRGFHFLHPIKMDHPEGCAENQWRPAPDCGRRVHVFMINGLDPVCKGNYNGVVRHLREHGYPNTYFGQLTHRFSFEREILKIKRCDPGAKIALVGFSLGANSIRGIANSLKKKGVWVDMLVYVAGDFIFDCKRTWPPNVGRVVNIRGHGLWMTGYDLVNSEDIPGARNVRIDCRHIATPTHPRSVTILREELFRISQTVEAGPACPHGCSRDAPFVPPLPTEPIDSVPVPIQESSSGPVLVTPPAKP